MKRVFAWVSVGVFVISLSAWSGFYLKKLRLSKRYKAEYKCEIDEYYTIDKAEDGVKYNEDVISHVKLSLSQEVLSKKKHQLQVDYILSSYVRNDSLIQGDIIDTASNRGEIPRIKNILFFSDRGKYQGPALQGKGPKFQTRDYKYFYNTVKQLVFTIHDSAQKKQRWKITRTDTVLTTGFQLIFSYPLEWSTGVEKDTMGLHCMELIFKSPSMPYFATNSMMKALGIETYHKGVAAVGGSVLIDKKTGRTIRYDEQGDFIGEMEMKSERVNSKWPSVYKYNKHFVLDALIKKPRKKFLGIF